MCTLDSFPKTVPQPAVQHFQEQYYLGYGQVIPDDALSGMRCAYNRLALDAYAKADLSSDRFAVVTKDYCHEQALMEQLANPHLVAIAQAVLGTDDIVYSGGFMMGQFCRRHDQVHGGWHTEYTPTSYHPLKHVNMWIYLNDVSIAHGATQVLHNSVPEIKRGLDARRPWEAIFGEQRTRAEQGNDVVWTVGSAGAGFVWGDFIVHQGSANTCGIPRMVVSYEFDVRQPGIEDNKFFGEVPAEQQAQVASWLPENMRYLVTP